jgi:hypothetical protein
MFNSSDCIARLRYNPCLSSREFYSLFNDCALRNIQKTSQIRKGNLSTARPYPENVSSFLLSLFCHYLHPVFIAALKLIKVYYFKRLVSSSKLPQNNKHRSLETKHAQDVKNLLLFL